MWQAPPLHAPPIRAGRLVAMLRIAFAAVLLLAWWLTPAAEPAALRALLAAYLGYALLLAPLQWNATARLEKAAHGLDLAALAVLLHVGGHAGSVYFLLSAQLLCGGALLWHRRGMLWTALALFAILVLDFLARLLVAADPAGPAQLVIELGFLALLTLALACLTRTARNMNHELTQLTDWPAPAGPGGAQAELEPLLRDNLQYAAGVMRAPAVLMIWDDAKEPYRHIAHSRGNEFAWRQEAPDTFEPPVAEDLGGASFCCSDTGRADPDNLYADAAGSRHWRGQLLHPELRAQFDARQVLALNLRRNGIDGWLLFLGMGEMDEGDLFLGELVARQVAVMLGLVHAQQEQQHSALEEQRRGLARDLHDSVLQSLAGIALKLERLRQSPQQDAAALRQSLSEAQALIADEQRELRRFIQQLRPGLGGDTQPQSSLSELAAGIERSWGVQVHLSTPASTTDLPPALARDIRYLLHEALVNAAKHAEATVLHVSLTREADRLRIRVDDNGHGFAFLGHYDLNALRALQTGPKSLQERILMLGGDLSIISSRSGSIVEMSIPWQAEPNAAAQATHAN